MGGPALSLLAICAVVFIVKYKLAWMREHVRPHAPIVARWWSCAFCLGFWTGGAYAWAVLDIDAPLGLLHMALSSAAAAYVFDVLTSAAERVGITRP